MEVLRITLLILRMISVTLVNRGGVNCISLTWERDAANDNFIFSGDVIFTIQLPSSVQCAHACHVTSVFCRYISFNSITQECRGYGQLTGATVQLNTIIWKRKCEEPGFIFEPGTDSCLQLSVVKQGRWQASSTCNSVGGRLVNLDTLAKLDVVLTGAQKETWALHAQWWVGAYKSGDQYFWSENLPVDQGAWYPGEPGGATCVNLYSVVAQFNDLDCASEEYFVCELVL